MSPVAGGGPVLIHSNVGDLLHSLDSPSPNVYNSPKLVSLNREGNIVVSYDKGGIRLFTVNGKLLCDISHSESVQVMPTSPCMHAFINLSTDVSQSQKLNNQLLQ